MIEVKMPELLNASMGVANVLHPTDGTLRLSMDSPSECTLTLEDKAEAIPMHGWVKIYNQLGFVGIYRRISRERDITTNNTYTLRHGIDILQDSVWDAEETYEGTTAQFLTALLNKQTQLVNGVKPWVLGSCADTSNVKKDINYDNLLDLLEGVNEQGSGYYFTYDQTSFPWTVSLVAKPSDVASEFRLNRNIERCRISDNDSELCTRLILNVNQMVDDAALAQKTGKTVKQNESVIRTYNNAAAQANYGIIVKTADIDVTGDTFPNGPFPEADAWAQKFLNQRADPLLNIEIDGHVLKGITGFDWDDSKIGTQVRVALPEYPVAIAERCVTVNYTSLYGDPDRVTVSLANALPTFSSSMKSTQKAVASNARGGRGAARQAESFDQHFQITDDAGNVLRQAGMHLDANGLLVYADDNENNVGTKFEVQANKIGMVIGTRPDGTNFVKGGEISLAINADHGTTATIAADCINIQGLVNAFVSYDISAESLFAHQVSSDGECTFDTIVVDSLQVNGYTNVLVDATVSGNTLTLEYDDGSTVTFSKAASLSGAWASGVFTVTAGIDGSTCLTSLTQGAASWSGKTVTIPIYATINSGAAVYDTGKSVTATYSGGSQTWSFGSLSTSSFSMSGDKTYSVNKNYNYAKFGITVDGETKYVVLHLIS
ncbi:MAG: hypothetical protein IKG23_05585 [Clostridia bacterium]|nr:hypothetical protein [Clostridia bacterium]